MPSSTIHLRPRTPDGLADEAVRRIVRSTATAIAERTGVSLETIRVEPDGVVAVLAASRLAAIGFAAELRRVTERWYTERTGEPTLWGEIEEADGD